MNVLEELEKIDDECDKHGIQFVKIDDDRAAKEYGIDDIPAIVYFEKQVPTVYSGDLENEEEILQWLAGQQEKDEIEDVTDEMLDKLVKEGRTLAVLFCKFTCWWWLSFYRKYADKSNLGYFQMIITMSDLNKFSKNWKTLTMNVIRLA